MNTDIKICGKRKNYTSRLTQKIIRYPDGQKRILSMTRWYWDRVEELSSNGYPFNEILEAAVILAKDLPSDHGFEWDLYACTGIMIRTCYANLTQDRYQAANVVSNQSDNRRP